MFIILFKPITYSLLRSKIVSIIILNYTIFWFIISNMFLPHRMMKLILFPFIILLLLLLLLLCFIIIIMLHYY